MLQAPNPVAVGVLSRGSSQVSNFQSPCATDTTNLDLGYSGAATNILTDLIYTVAPLVYISKVQLPKRTIWGVRAVFLLGLM